MRLHQLDTLRFVFAAIVVLGHTATWRNTVPAGGLAVDYFFILSGFVLALSMARKEHPVFGPFLKARLARLYPLYLLTLLFCLPPPGWVIHHLTDTRLLLNLLLLQNIFPTGDMGYNWPAWSVSAELWVNIGILFWIIRYRLIWLALLVSGSCYALLWQHQLVDHAHIQPVYGLTAGLLRCTAGILAGYLIFRLYAWIRDSHLAEQLPDRWFSLAEGLTLLPASALLLTAPGGLNAPTLTALGLMPLMILVFAFGRGRLSALLAHRWLSRSGNFSYGIYLIHAPLLLYLREQGFLPITDTATPPAAAALVLLASFALSIPAYYGLERPARQWLMQTGRTARIETAP